MRADGWECVGWVIMNKNGQVASGWEWVGVSGSG